MQKITICLLTLFALSSSPASAGSGHSHDVASPISEDQALKKATGVVANIVKAGKLDTSWTQLKPIEAKKKINQNGSEWIITFKNPNEKDKTKQTLYVFLSLSGEYLAANFSGV